jgi:hypothetical protein
MQIFHRSTNTVSRVSLFGAVFFIAFLSWVTLELSRSSYMTRQGLTLKQPVPFSHEHHVSGLGIDCRYCHTSVDKSAVAGIPPTETCMNCHRSIWTNAELLEPIRASYKNNVPMQWAKVNDLPDYVYFNHSVHIAKGMGCVTCHGPVGKMQLMYQDKSLLMEWCIDCHRNPVKNARPRRGIYDPNWQPSTDVKQQQEDAAEIKGYHLQSLTSCSTCHR